MGVGAGLSMYVVVVQKFTLSISSPDEFLFYFRMEPRLYTHRSVVEAHKVNQTRLLAINVSFPSVRTSPGWGNCAYVSRG